MKQAQFEHEQAAHWEAYRGLLDQLEGPRRRRQPDAAWEQLPGLYRRLCGHYALATSRGYSPGLVATLHALVLRGHRQLHLRPEAWLGLTVQFLAAGFPQAVRRHAGAFALALALFFGPMLVMGLACHADGTLIHSLLDGEQVANLEAMYDPTSDKPGRGLEQRSATDFAMFGFYVWNNVGIAFRTFTGGLLWGLGTLFHLIFNGLVIGAAAGHLTQLGHGGPFWAFVSGHAALELTAIAIAGTAGLRLGAAMISPGRRTRVQALRHNALEAVPLVVGAMVMLVAAALVEGFWSASAAPAEVKHLAGIVGGVLVALYLVGAGRD